MTQFQARKQGNNPSESELRMVWQHQFFEKNRLLTETGEAIEVIYPGRVNDEEGADFRDAVIATNQGLVKGDIEVHVNSSGWQEHQHHLNRVYNRVILHVVLWHNANKATKLQNGKEVPVLALQKHLKSPDQGFKLEPTSITVPCFKTGQRVEAEVTGLLDKAGEARFFVRIARFQTDLAPGEASQ